MNLYPLKFEPILKEKIWGGNYLNQLLNKKNIYPNIGESWEISGIRNNVSIINNGFLQENNLHEIIKIYKNELVGNRIYDEFGTEFPLLIKFIDAQEDLSIQVHPNNKQAKDKHNSYGKTEIWYVLHAEKDAKLISGFSENIDKETFEKHLKNNTLDEILNYENVKTGDVFFIPSGRVHSIGKGIVVAEIQQTSDITYRLYDYNRLENGKLRELHTKDALDVIDFQKYDNYKTQYTPKLNESIKLESNEFFTVNLLEFNTLVEREFQLLDSFVIYVCVEGKMEIETIGNEKITLQKGESVLVPACIKKAMLNAPEKAKLLEIYIK